MPPKCCANDGIWGRKGGGNCGPPTQHRGRKRPGRVVVGVPRPDRYPTSGVALSEIFKYHRHGGYLILKAPFHRLCEEIGSDWALEQQFRWQRSAVEYRQVAAEEFLLMTMTSKLNSSPSIII